MDLVFKIEQWGPGGSPTRTYAMCDNLVIVRAAYDAAVEQYPKSEIALRHGARVIAEWPRRER